jgi:hypothetical protein
MAEPTPPPVALRQRREQTISRLCDLFARDYLEAEELEQLIDRAHQATTLAQLDELTAKLPTPEEATDAADSTALAPHGGDREHQVVFAVMSGARRAGRWTPARNLYVTAVMGGVALDFRDAQLQPGVTEVYVVAVMGGVEITVAPGTFVESTGFGLMGGFDHGADLPYPVDTSAPVLRIHGMAIMGGVDIRERERRIPEGEQQMGEVRRQLRKGRKGVGE